MLVSVDLFNAIAVRVRLGKKGYCAVLDRELGMVRSEGGERFAVGYAFAR
jgi:hypothetical protein